ncbi:fatty acid desaturase [Alphaproteobacteria bacterium]|nr:fatty acid desaturase [Alphaproteobacteria bacterium]
MSQDTNTQFVNLSKVPIIAWPSILLFLGALGAFAITTFFALSGSLDWWIACLLNGGFLYFLFSPMHDALHGSASSNVFLNEAIGRLSLAAFIPAAPMEIARWVHLKHHAHTTADIDPDNFMHHGRWFILPFRWANFDFYYLKAFFESDDRQVKRNRKMALVYLASFVLVSAFIIANGYLAEYFILWFLPTRIALGFVGYVFVFLPHYPAQISSKEDKYKATTMRLGYEWLLTPLMVAQNYHLIHHLYPNIPFYRYLKVWSLRRDEIMAKNPAIQRGFSLSPEWQ